MATGGVNAGAAGPANGTNPNADFEVPQPPGDAIMALEFSPATMYQTYLISGSWDKSVRCWEVRQGQAVQRAMHSMSMPVMDACWSGDGRKVFMASNNHQVHYWDLRSDRKVYVAAHDAPASICRWIQTPTYTCLMTSSWDKTLKFWDLRSSVPVMTMNLPEKAYCADVGYPFAIFGTASKDFVVYSLEGTPSLLGTISSPLRHHHRCIAINRDKVIRQPTGFCYGNFSGRVGIFSSIMVPRGAERQFFSFKCHRRNVLGVRTVQNIYAVNDIKVHPVHSMLATVGSDGTYAFWDYATRTRLMVSNILDKPITKCCFDTSGEIFAYCTGYDLSKGFASTSLREKPKIFLRPCFKKMIPAS